MSEDISRLNSAPVKPFTDETTETVAALIQQHQINRQKALISFSFPEKKAQMQLLQLFDFCSNWVAAYDEAHQTLFDHYQVTASDSGTNYMVKLLADDRPDDIYKFIPATALNKTEYFLICRSDGHSDAVALCKSLSNGEQVMLNLASGLQEMVSSLTTSEPLLPVLRHDSLEWLIPADTPMLRLFTLNIDDLDLHLDLSRKKIFNTLAQNVTKFDKLQGCTGNHEKTWINR